MLRRVAAMAGWRRTAVLSGVAVAVRSLYLLLLTAPGAVRSDAAHYHEIASNVAAGDGLSSTFPQLTLHATAFRPPLYPVMLGALYRVTGPSVVAGKWMNIFIGVAVVLLADRVATRLRGPGAGLVAGMLVAISPSIVANDTNLLSEPLGLLLLLAVWLTLDDDRWVWAAILTGAMVLTRPSAQLFAVVLVVWIARRAGARRALAFGVVMMLVVAPWIVRNHVEVGTWNLFTSNGFNIAAMYSEPAQQTRSFVDPVQDPRFEANRLDQFDEAQWDRTMQRLGTDGVRAHPAYVLENVSRNAAAMFELHPSYNDGAEREDGRNADARRLGLPLFFAVSAAGVYGWWLARDRRLTQLLVVGAVSFVAIALLFLSPPRLRAPWDLACCIGAGVAAADVVRARVLTPKAARGTLQGWLPGETSTSLHPT